MLCGRRRKLSVCSIFFGLLRVYVEVKSVCVSKRSWRSNRTGFERSFGFWVAGIYLEGVCLVLGILLEIDSDKGWLLMFGGRFCLRSYSSCSGLYRYM